jgi:hypothetical protein
VATQETGAPRKNRGEPKGIVIVSYLVLSAIAAVCLAILLQERMPQYPAERWFFGFFWLMFAGGVLLVGWRLGRGAMALLAAAYFLVAGVVSFVFGLAGFGVLAAITLAPAIITRRLRL